jgi:hypothetical protein
MTGLLSTILLLLAFAVTEASIGPRGDHLTSFLALLCLLPALLLLGSGSAWKARRGLAVLALIAVGVGIWYAQAGVSRWYALTSSLGFLAVLHERGSPKRQLAHVHMLTTLGFAGFLLVRDYLPLWPQLVRASVFASSAATGLAGEATRLGPSYSGMWLVVSFALACLARAVVVRRFRAGPGSIALALLLPLALAALILRERAPVHVHGFDLRMMLGWRLAQFTLMLPALALFVWAHPLGDLGSGHGTGRSPMDADTTGTLRSFRTRAVLAWAGVALMLSGVVLLAWRAHVPAHTGRVLLDRRGSFSMEPLGWDQYGPEVPGGASLASLPQLLRTYGFAFTTSDTLLDADLLSRHDVLVVMNPTNKHTREELAAIWAFVRSGGGLLVLGDHTNIQGTMPVLNDLLEPTGVRFEFDSAIPLVQRWTWYGCMRVHPHPVTTDVRDETDVKISVGASLHLPPDALPLFSGRDAFADPGDWSNLQGAYLGNMAYDRGERLSDLFLAAEVPVGRGKVVVFGDTSTFQRVAVFNTHELIARTMSHLAGAGRVALPWRLRVAGTVLATAGFLLVVSTFPTSAPVVGLASVLLTACLLGLEGRMGAQLPERARPQDIAWVDLGHGNRVDTHSGVDHGISGLTNHLWREGWVPLVMKGFAAEALEGSRLFVTVAPAFPFKKREIDALRRFVESGGLLVVASGYEENRGTEALLAEFDFAIGRTPIGAAHQVSVNLENQGVLMHESWPVLHPEGRGEVWVECWGYPLVVFERIGAGGLLVIGDSGLLWDANLESNDRYVDVNVAFLRAAFEAARLRIEDVR